MTIANTIMEVVSTGQEFNIPGEWTAAQLVESYSGSVSGLGGMQSAVTTENDGTTRRVVFSPRTGTKG